jgi:hypothetical protein
MNNNFAGSVSEQMSGYDFTDVKNVDRYIRRSLAGIGRTTTKIIHDNFTAIMEMTTVPGLTLMLSKLFAEQDLDTPATRRLLENIGTAPSADVAKGIICNSFLSGDGNGVIRI